ncbi:MAG TPA: NAD(P)H-binding protein [Candidatus Dormibacteraeota bacterium]|nr:NAD(P)H-binding protein [Candidatus Dormibacteraeota bacterium]
MNILVTGGTGALGRRVVKRLLASRHRARVLSRRPGTGDDWVQGDLATGAGLETAVIGIDAIIHAGSATMQPQTLRATDVLGTRRLLAMAREAGVRHTVYVSIVGIDEVAYPYYKYKLAAEAVMRENIVPWSILRATQFHTLMEFFLGGFSKVPRLALVPFKWQFQPVDTDDVAKRLVDVVTGDPAGMLPDFGGPDVRDFKSIAESWLKVRHPRKRLVNLWLPMKFSRQFEQGRLLCPDHKDGTVTFEQYLERRYPKQP